MVCLGEVVIATEIALVDMVLFDRGNDVIVSQLSGLVRKRIEIHNVLCQRQNFTGRDDIALELCTGVGYRVVC